MVPARETGMTAYEFMLSESQERMLMVLRPDREQLARDIFDKVGSGFRRHRPADRIPDESPCGITGMVEAEIPLAPLNDQAPLYTRPTADTPKREKLNPARIEDRFGLTRALEKLVACPDLCSRAWVWDQYDSTVGGQTVKRPGAADAAVVKLEGLPRALALTTDCTPRYCAADPESGGAQAVAEAWRNLTAVGARPLAHHRQYEFRQSGKAGDHGPVRRRHPRHGRRMRGAGFPRRLRQCQLVQRDRGPTRILPTPAIGGLGVLDDAALAVGLALPPWLDIVADRRHPGLAWPVPVAA